MLVNNTETILILVNMVDIHQANDLAEQLVMEKLVACVNVLSPCQSFYMWEGNLEQTTEVPMLLKTTLDRYEAVETFIIQRHDYDVPEIIVLPIQNGYAPYLSWVKSNVSS